MPTNIKKCVDLPDDSTQVSVVKNDAEANFLNGLGGRVLKTGKTYIFPAQKLFDKEYNINGSSVTGSALMGYEYDSEKDIAQEIILGWNQLRRTFFANGGEMPEIIAKKDANGLYRATGGGRVSNVYGGEVPFRSNSDKERYLAAPVAIEVHEDEPYWEAQFKPAAAGSDMLTKKGKKGTDGKTTTILDLRSKDYPHIEVIEVPSEELAYLPDDYPDHLVVPDEDLI